MQELGGVTAPHRFRLPEAQKGHQDGDEQSHHGNAVGRAAAVNEPEIAPGPQDAQRSTIPSPHRRATPPDCVAEARRRLGVADLPAHIGGRRSTPRAVRVSRAGQPRSHGSPTIFGVTRPAFVRSGVTYRSAQNSPGGSTKRRESPCLDGLGWTLYSLGAEAAHVFLSITADGYEALDLGTSLCPLDSGTPADVAMAIAQRPAAANDCPAPSSTGGEGVGEVDSAPDEEGHQPWCDACVEDPTAYAGCQP